MSALPLLSVRGLRTEIVSPRGSFAAVEDVSFDVGAGERLAIVGESGSGKTVTALSILRLLPEPPARITAGEVHFGGRDLMALPPARMRRVRGREIAMIFQEPMTSLNPVFTVGSQLCEILALHRGLRGRAARRRAIELLGMVNIPSPERRLASYPHELSGGTRQRVMIAMVLASEPKLLIADEPTTALDVTVQAQLLDLLLQLQRELGMAIILITHDLGIVAEFAERVLVMYAGGIVEQGPVAAIFAAPRHPYTEGLLGSIPPIDRDVAMLTTIEGSVPSPGARLPGCRFMPRCGFAGAPCAARLPGLLAFGPAHRARCIRHTGYASGETG
jgi:oligopeptide/dipeptide ABC transporter ATP-binding protein